MKRKTISAALALIMTVGLIPVSGMTEENTAADAILRYTFDDDSNPLGDQDGKNALTLSGGAEITEEGNKGKALLLNGSDGFAVLPENIISDNMTITAWVKINKFTSWGRVFDLGTDSNNNFFFAPYSGSSARVEIKSPEGTDTMDTDQETVKGEWVHYAVTVSDGTVSYYRNGKLIQSKTGVQDLGALKNTLNYIGKSHYESDAYLAAAVDDFRIYDSGLSRDDIIKVMADGEISADVMLDSYSIDDKALIAGDKIELPSADNMTWSEKDSLGLIDTSTGAVKHNENAETVTLVQSYGDKQREYTLYITGTKENPYAVNIDAADRSNDVSDIMWGLFFEDINSAADGGLYAELVQNRSFEMSDSLYSWTTSDNVLVSNSSSMNENNPTYITMPAGTDAANDGFQGMSLKAGEKYNFSMYVNGNTEFTVSAGGASIVLKSEDSDGWNKLEGEIVPTETTSQAILTVKNSGENDADVDMISLIPEDTYKGHGLRKDLMEQLENMHPKFLRFPGGCAVEGQTMDTAWNWKDTIGDISERKEMVNIWNPSATEPYMMTYGLGFYEYFQMCEDLGMEPVPILNCGMACQVRSGNSEDEEYLVPMDELQPYIDDALDLIEFANGTDESSEWVQKRIEMGHKEPFNLKYIGIGNEQYGNIYFERYAEFAKQIHEKYPDINLVTTSGTASSGTSNDIAWNWAKNNSELADRMDEHYYETADWFNSHVYRYDNYSRNTDTKVFLGEYASKGNTWYNALSEAAFMTGLERNADVVRMASYAPMFAKYGNTQWTAADMIWFNNDDYVLTPNYYVQSLFSNNKGDYSLPTNVVLNGIDADDSLHGGIALGTWKTQAEFKDVEVTDLTSGAVIGSDNPKQNVIYSADFNTDWKAANGTWSVGEDGTLSQSSEDESCLYYLDTQDFSSYSVSLKAKKTGGSEGFLIGAALKDSNNLFWANIGGWSNTASKMQKVTDGSAQTISNVAEQCLTSDINIENDKWYDIRMDVTDYEITVYVNGELSCSYTHPKEYGLLYASSVYDEESGDVIVKLVNMTDSEARVDLNVSGMNTSNTANVTVMSGDTSLENTLDNKDAIVPSENITADVSNGYTAPANSFSVIRLETRQGYISGYEDGTFRPDNTVTRAETAAIIARIGDYSEDTEYTSQTEFSDTENKWYSGYVSYASSKDYISGYEDGTFKPENPITRAEFSAILCRYMNLTPNYKVKFADVNADHWAVGYIGVLNDGGIVNGYETKFYPDQYITRAEAVKMINTALNYEVSDKHSDNPFSDLSSSHWAYDHILTAVAAN